MCKSTITVPTLCVNISNLSNVLIKTLGDFNCKLRPKNLSYSLSFQVPVQNYCQENDNNKFYYAKLKSFMCLKLCIPIGFHVWHSNMCKPGDNGILCTPYERNSILP